MVRASRELGVDRLDTSVGPLAGRGARGPACGFAVICEPNEWGVALRHDLHRHRRPRSRSPRPSAASYGRVTSDVTRYAQVGVVGGLARESRGKTYAVTPDVGRARVTGRGVCAPSARPRRPASGRRTRRGRTGFFHQWLPMQFDDFVIKVQIDEDCSTATAWSRSRCRCTTSGPTGPTSTSAARRSTSPTSPARARSRSGAHAHQARRRRLARSQHAAAHALPRGRHRVPAPRRLGPRRVPGPAQGRGHRVRPEHAPEARAE